MRHPPRIRGRRAALGACALLGLVAALLIPASAAARPAAGPTEPVKATQCGSKPIKIAFVSILENTYGQVIEQGMKQYLAPCKNVSVTNFNATDPQSQYSAFQDIATLHKYQGIAFLPLSPTGVIPAMKKAIAAGIQVVNFNNPVGNNYKTAAVNVPGEAGTVLESQYNRGIWLAEMSAEACAGISDCQIGFIGGNAPAAEGALKEGFDLGMHKHSNMHLVAYSLNGQYLPGPGETVAQDMLTAHRQLNVITGSGDQMMVGAQLAIEHAGLSKQVKIVGLGGSVQGVAAVKAGKWFGTIITQPIDQGRLTGWVLLRHILNPKLPPQGINPFTYTHRSPLLTKGTLAKTHFVPQWSA